MTNTMDIIGLGPVPYFWVQLALQVGGILFACFVFLPWWSKALRALDAWQAWNRIPGPPAPSLLAGHTAALLDPRAHIHLSK